jgi:hypothetical protein
VDADVRDRLLEAWHGEIEAGAVYELIARRERDPQRAEILRKMAAAEGGPRDLTREQLDFLVGAAKSLFTLRSWWSSGLEMTLAGVIVGGITYAVGLGFS